MSAEADPAATAEAVAGRDTARAAATAVAAAADDAAACGHRVLDGQVLEIDVAGINEEATLGVEAVDRVRAAVAVAAVDRDARPAQQIERVQLRREAEVGGDVDRVVGILRGVYPAGIHLQDGRVELGDVGDIEDAGRDDLHDRSTVGILRELETGTGADPGEGQRIGRGAVRDR
nr:hypothetical protein [Bradyrhizobium sp. 2S1]